MCKSPTAWKIANSLILYGNSVSRSATRFDNKWIPQIYQELLGIFQNKDEYVSKDMGWLMKGSVVTGSSNLDLSA